MTSREERKGKTQREKECVPVRFVCFSSLHLHFSAPVFQSFCFQSNNLTILCSSLTIVCSFESCGALFKLVFKPVFQNRFFSVSLSSVSRSLFDPPDESLSVFTPFAWLTIGGKLAYRFALLLSTEKVCFCRPVVVVEGLTD